MECSPLAEQARVEAVIEEEEQWAANPWQAQVDAHIMQLRQAGASFPQVLNSSSSSSSNHQSIGATVGTNPASCSALQGTPSVMGGIFVATLPPLELTPRDFHSAFGPSEPTSPKSSGCNIATVQDDLIKRNAELEGTIALLEENLMKKDRELAEAVCSSREHGNSSVAQNSRCRNASLGGDAIDTNALMAEVVDLRRHNEFLSTLVTRFEGKTMVLEKDIVALTAGQLNRVNELEGQVALLEDIVAQRDGELNNAFKRLASEEAERKKRDRQTELDALAREDSAKLKEEVAFLSNVVRRFEQKTMDLEVQLEVLSKAKEECIANEKKLEVCRQNLDFAQTAAALHQEREHAERTLRHELQKSQSETEERLEEERQAAESATLALRDYKKDHNQKMQELLRKTQALEKQKRDLEGDLVAAKEANAEAEKLVRLRTGSEELDEMRLLNKQIVERLGNERSEHMQSRQNLTQALDALDIEKAEHAQTKHSSSEILRENETLSIRLEYLVGQLYELATRNDALQAEVLAAEEGRRILDFDADLHLMS